MGGTSVRDRERIRLRAALNAGTTGSAFWRTVPGDDGVPVDLVVTEANEAFAAWVGRPLAEIIGARYSALFPDGVLDRLPRYLQAVADGQAIQVRREYTVPDGAPSTYEIRMSPCGPDELFAGVWDVGERVRFERDMDEARAALTESNDALEAALNAVNDGCVVYRATRSEAGVIEEVRVVYMNDAGATPTGRSPAQLRGLELREMFPEALETGLWAHVLEAFDSGKQQTFIVETESAGGWVGSFENVITPISDDRAVLIWRDVSRAGSTVVRPSDDALTGLPTRGSFRRGLAERIREVGTEASLVVIDLDRFGLIDDQHGWRTGDLVLVEVARRLRGLVPATEPIARIDADEFAFVLPDAIGVGELEHLLRSLHRLEVAGMTLRVSASTGIRRLDAGIETDRLMQEANAACRVAFAEGGDQVVLHDPLLQERLLSSSLQAEEIRAAVRHGELRLQYQPIVELAGSATWGHEALVRWQHPRLGTVSPHRFIPAAESSRAIVDVGQWIIEEAARAASAMGLGTRLTLNVSVIQLLHDDVVTGILHASDRHGVDPAVFGLEITESELIDDIPRIVEQIHRARAEGILIAIDDFGSGYSSLRYLDQLPIDIVKIDAAFFREPLSERRAEVIAASVRLAEAIEAVALAEGLETERQVDAAREAGVTLGQGWIFGRPQAWSEAGSPD